MSVKNKNTSEQLLERRLILESDLADGALDTIFGPVKANLQTFGTILKDSAKLIGGDIGFLVKLTFSRLKSLDEYSRMRKDNNRRRKDLLGSISKNSDALMDSWPDGKITSMLIAPGLFFTTSALSGMDKITSKEFRDEVGTYGLNQVWPLSIMFGGEPDREYRVMQDISRCEPGDAQCMDKAWERFSSSLNKDKNKSSLNQLATKINKIFLFAGNEILGDTILEGEETGETDGPPDLSEEQYKMYADRVKQEIDKSLEEEREKWFKGQKKYFEKIIEEASNVIKINTTLAATQDSKEFFLTLEKLKKTAGDEMKDLDVNKLQTAFIDIGKKIKDDKDSMEKIKKSFEDEKIEETEENLTKKLEEITLSSFKGTFLQELKGVLTDYYEEVYTTITGGVTPEQKKIIVKDPYGKEYLSTIDLYEKKLKDALSNLK